MANDEQFKDEATRKAEYEAAQKEQKEINERSFKRNEHYNERKKQLNDKEFFWQLDPAGAGLFINCQGVFNIRFLVPKEPRYKAIDNIIQTVMLKGCPPYWTEQEPYSLLVENSDRGDRLRDKIHKAYKCALLVYDYCEEKEIDIFHFAKNFNPDFETLFDYELLKFFKKKLD